MFGRLPARIALLVLVLAGGAAAFAWWNSPERRIARILTAVADAMTHDEPGSGLDALTAVAALQPHLAPEISLDTGSPSGPLIGRQEVISLAARLRAGSQMMRVQWFDPDVELQDGSRATLRATAQVTTRNALGEDVVDVHQVRASLEERDGEWMVVSARRESDQEEVP